MYTDLIPKLSRLDSALSCPKTYFADNEEGIIVMENLKKKDFYIIDKQTGGNGGRLRTTCHCAIRLL